MNADNPYLPPKARVSDVELATPLERNLHVDRACRLMWIGFLLSVVHSLLGLFTVSGVAQFVGQVIGAAIGAALGYLILNWVTRKLALARNWMRWLITSLNMLGWLSIGVFWNFYKINVFPVYTANPVIAISMLIQIAIGMAALYFLHTQSAREWFARAGRAVA